MPHHSYLDPRSRKEKEAPTEVTLRPDTLVRLCTALEKIILPSILQTRTYLKQSSQTAEILRLTPVLPR